MVVYTTGGNTSIKKEFFFKVGGYDEKIPRMADVELGFRLFKSGAKMYHSAKIFLHHRKSIKGGTRKSQSNIPYLRLVSYLYIYKKHFPGWSLKIPFLSGLTEKVKHDFRQWAKDKPGWF